MTLLTPVSPATDAAAHVVTVQAKEPIHWPSSHCDRPEGFMPGTHPREQMNPEGTLPVLHWLGMAAPPLTCGGPLVHGARASDTLRSSDSFLCFEVAQMLVGGPPGGPGSRL